LIDFIHIFISIITAVIFIIASLATAQDPNDTLLRLIFIIIGSYIAGLILRAYLKKNVFKEPVYLDDDLFTEETPPEDTATDEELEEEEEEFTML